MITSGGTTTLGLYDFKIGIEQFGQTGYWVQKANGYPINKRIMLANGDIVKSTIDGNVNDPNTDMTGWVKTNSASQIVDASGRTQHEINNAITKTFEYFNNDFIAAANWIKESTANYVELSAKEYTLPDGNVYFNRFFCRKGSATIHVSPATYLQYGSFANDEVLHLEGIDYVVDGHRRDVYSTGYVLLYTTRINVSICKTAFIERIRVYGMKDGSYVDDVGKTRAEGFIDYGVTEFSYINDVKTYGVGAFASIRPLSENAQHFEHNFTGVNCETGIYYPRGLTWLSGDTDNMQIINTLTQREYWGGMSAGRVNNGMDVIMNESSYATKYKLRKIYAKCAIERSIYVMSDNADVDDIEDVESHTMGSCKSQMLTTPLTRVRAANFRAKDVKNKGYKLSVYGSDNIIIDGFDYSQESRDGSRLLAITNTNYCELRNFSVSNINQLFYYTPESSSNKIKFINFNVKDCYTSNVHYVFGQIAGEHSIGELYFDNFKMSVPQNIATLDMYYQAIDARRVGRFIAKNCHFYISTGLYQYDSSLTYAELTDVKVSVITSTNLNSIFNVLSSSATNYIAASIFDVLIDIKSTVTPSVKTQIKCVKQVDTGLANCAQNWKDISLEIPVTTAPASYPLFSFGAVSYFVDVEFAGSIMRYFYNATTNTITEQVNAGGKLATGAPQADKITFNASTANNYRLDIAIGGSGTWSGGGGTLRVKIHR